MTGKRKRLLPMLGPALTAEQSGIVGAQRHDEHVAESSGMCPQFEQFET
jgi:hypothetical protein